MACWDDTVAPWNAIMWRLWRWPTNAIPQWKSRWTRPIAFLSLPKMNPCSQPGTSQPDSPQTTTCACLESRLITRRNSAPWAGQILISPRKEIHQNLAKFRGPAVARHWGWLTRGESHTQRRSRGCFKLSQNASAKMEDDRCSSRFVISGPS